MKTLNQRQGVIYATWSLSILLSISGATQLSSNKLNQHTHCNTVKGLSAAISHFAFPLSSWQINIWNFYISCIKRPFSDVLTHHELVSKDSSISQKPSDLIYVRSVNQPVWKTDSKMGVWIFIVSHTCQRFEKTDLKMDVWIFYCLTHLPKVNWGSDRGLEWRFWKTD